MNNAMIFLLLILATPTFSQTKKESLDWEALKTNDAIPHDETMWLDNNLTRSERDEVISLVSALSQPAASQLLVSYFYLDGSYKKKSVKPYLDSLSVRPPDGEAGIVRVAYLVSKLRKERIEVQQSISYTRYYASQFNGTALALPGYEKQDINRNIELSFDYRPAQVILDILSRPDVSYKEILEETDLHQFKELMKHRSQSFYDTPLTKEKLATCLRVASSTSPIDVLYRYMNPDGLLYFTDIKTYLADYKRLLSTLFQEEQNIFDYINASISPFLPHNTAFARKVSFFFINDADGWASGDVTALDLNYFKDRYDKLLPLLVHETYHSAQNAIDRKDTVQRPDNVQAFVDVLNYVFREGTASYIAPPAAKTKEEVVLLVKEGIQLMEDVYRNTITDYGDMKAEELVQKGVSGAGPFYWLGAEMSRVIVDELGKEQLAAIIPDGGVTFFKTYLKAVAYSPKSKNMFSDTVTAFISDTK